MILILFIRIFRVKNYILMSAVRTKEILAFPTYWTGWIRFCNGRVLHKIRLGTYGLKKQENLPQHL